jgi:hypothetical protein
VLGAQGGVVSLESGLTLEVPQGALSNRVQVTLQENRLDGYSDIQIEPVGAALTAPVSLSWADEGDDTLESDGVEPISIDRSGGRAHASLHHFGHFRHWRHCGRDGGVDGGACPGRVHDDGGISGHGKSCDGGGCSDGDDDDRDGGEGHGPRGGCTGAHDAGHHPSPGDNAGCHEGGEHHGGGHCSGGHATDAGVRFDGGLPQVP